MKVKKSVDVQAEGSDIIDEYSRKLNSLYDKETNWQAHNNCVLAFKKSLQQFADTAFKLGQKNP